MVQSFSLFAITPEPGELPLGSYLAWLASPANLTVQGSFILVSIFTNPEGCSLDATVVAPRSRHVRKRVENLFRTEEGRSGKVLETW